MIGKKYNRLTVLEFVEKYKTPSGQYREKYLCECDCGNKIIVCGVNIRNGNTKSCGCLKKEVNHERFGAKLLNKRFGLLTDVIKANYCLFNNITLYYIRYDDDIEQMIYNILWFYGDTVPSLRDKSRLKV